MVAELIRRRPARDCAVEGPAGLAGGMSSARPSWLRRWARPAGRPRTCCGWRTTWRSSCRAPGPRSGRVSSTPRRPRSSPRHPGPGPRGGQGRRSARVEPGRVADPSRAAVRDRPRGHADRPGQGPQAPGTSRQGYAGGAVGRGFRGNAALAGREVPPAQVLAADQRVTGWARELKRAGLDGDDGPAAGPGLPGYFARHRLPARGQRPAQPGADGGPQDRSAEDAGPLWPRPGRRAGSARAPDPRTGRAAGRDDPPGFAGQVNLTIPLATMPGLAARPGEMAGIGPVDPGLARDLAAAAARNPRSTWCLTVTDEHGHAIGHGCARPEPANRRAKPGQQGTSGGRRSPRRPGVHPHARRSWGPDRPARRLRDMEVLDRGPRAAGPAHRNRSPAGELRSPASGQRP